MPKNATKHALKHRANAGGKRGATRNPSTRSAVNLAGLYTPSPALAAVVGEKPMTRAKFTAQLWAYIREHGCQDPADKRVIVGDDKLRPIIGERCGMFDLPGKLSAHLKPV